MHEENLLSYNTSIVIDGLDIAIFTSGELMQKSMGLQSKYSILLKEECIFLSLIVCIPHYTACFCILKNVLM